MAIVISGKELAKNKRDEMKNLVPELEEKYGRRHGLPNRPSRNPGSQNTSVLQEKRTEQ